MKRIICLICHSDVGSRLKIDSRLLRAQFDVFNLSDFHYFFHLTGTGCLVDSSCIAENNFKQGKLFLSSFDAHFLIRTREVQSAYSTGDSTQNFH
ncbi:CLUMA_CG018563, isoform A [Clunio marinus]|uniref:CLUMA_CG018563, isoform A n=1 Tax=Clunio marinus TaxID=568069 RepID=A0A1J1J205_9DIPT|nr:CLUMA_CG018563, isoform A [Clunio marinus]